MSKVGRIPRELRALAQWVVSVPDGQPKNARTGGNAMSNKPATWSDFDTVVKECARRGDGSLPAFALTAEDSFCAIDLDDKHERPASEEIRALFDTLVEGLDSYTERSRSGRGIHVIVRAGGVEPLKTAHVEVFDRNHFITLTGDTIGKAKPVQERSAQVKSIVTTLRPAKSARAMVPVGNSSEDADEHVIERARVSATTGDKFQALHAGRWDDLGIGDGTQSTADLAYVGMLWDASGNRAQVERLWRASPLAERDKGRREDYIAAMLDRVTASPPRLLSAEGPASLFSDTANAHRIVHHFGSDLLFVPGIGWHVWGDSRWQADSLEARRLGGKLGRIVLGEASALLNRASQTASRAESDDLQDLGEKLMKFATPCENVNKIESALKAAEPLLRCDASTLDADPWVLGCTNGIVDLRTGLLIPPAHDQLITKTTGVTFDPEAVAPTWMGFLSRIFRKHSVLPEFLQRLAGYWLTGLTDPAYVAVLYGVGANGKSTFVNGLLSAMGDYARIAPPGLLMAKYGERHPTELATLQGLRFVVAAESGEGGRLDEERIKALSGSDAITARRMREDFYTFNPTHKLAMQTNHKPVVRGVDEGIWRRLLLIPFEEVIPAAERDPGLTAALRREASGILRWAVEGARLLAENNGRLALPQLVEDATRAYRTESDVLGQFLSEEFVEDVKGFIASSNLYASYESWCDENGERAMSKKALGLRLQDKGFTSKQDRRGQRGWQGLALRQSSRIRG